MRTRLHLQMPGPASAGNRSVALSVATSCAAVSRSVVANVVEPEEQLASAQGTGCLQFAECSPRDFTELVGVSRVAPALVGELPGERAQFGGHARGQVGNAAAAERAAHGRGESEALQRFA